ncbi:MAG: hypothetical protein ACRD50_02680 [Candidatus Acidiferrales bacterium]
MFAIQFGSSVSRIDPLSKGKPNIPSLTLPGGAISWPVLRPMEKLTIEERGRTLDVLNIVRQLGKPAFNLPDVYASEKILHRLHPSNRHVHDKIARPERHFC